MKVRNVLFTFKEVNFREKILEEENLDLKSKVLSLIKSNDRLKQELVIRSKSEKMYETKKYHDVKYKSKFQKSSSPTKVSICTLLSI